MFRPETRCYCQWCAERGLRREFFKLRDGPIDWWFCNEDHALEWLEKRHSSAALNRYLHKTPSERISEAQTGSNGPRLDNGPAAK